MLRAVHTSGANKNVGCIKAKQHSTVSHRTEAKSKAIMTESSLLDETMGGGGGG